jgi:signal transduction histidine kinase
MLPTPTTLYEGMPSPRRSAVAKTGAHPLISSSEHKITAAPRALREEKSSSASDKAIWESRSVAICLVASSGEIVRANRKFLEMTGYAVLAAGASVGALLAETGLASSVVIESIPAGETGEEFWILVPSAQPYAHGEAEERSDRAFRLLHDSVAQSVAALAMNLFLVKQSGATSHSPAAEKMLRSSLELVEQCAKEVRGICTLLQRQSKPGDRTCA